jgi:hypothetical protein
MRGAILVLCALLAYGVAGRSTGTLAPSAALESFLESGEHTASEIDAMATAEVESVLGNDVSVESEAESEGEAPVPPPKKLGAAAPAEPSADRDDVIRLVYDELKRLGSASSTTLPPAPGSPAALQKSDPRVRQLESRLSMFEKKRTEEVNKAQDTAISSINKRLEGLDRTLSSLKQSAEKQQSLTEQLIRSKKANVDAKKYVNTQDYSVSYEKETIPADFELRVSDLLNSVKDEARKIYERHCPNCRKPNPPKVYPNEPTPAPKAKKPMIPKNPFKREPKMKRDLALEGEVAKMHAETEAEEKADKAMLDKDIAHDKPTGATHDEAPKEPSPAPSPAAPKAPPANSPPPMSQPPVEPKDNTPKPEEKEDDGSKIRKRLFRPVIIGKEPTSEGMRLSKALNDISLALPVTPAYSLGKAEQALQDVLGADAVGKRFKTPRL